ncbi:MAG: septum formation inhibitor Maf, partial [Planctomycetes bacterium]|nr:septum formation inhibitor Maf [Planctomycetota bacterium]
MNRPLRIVLASRSPRRMEILRREGVHFESIEADVDDAATPPQGDPREAARALAVAKAQAVAGAHADRCRDAFVVAADTICHHRGESVGKASDPDEARTILARMMDGAHAVVTGVAIMRHGALQTFVDEATVRLERVSAADM